MFIQPGFDAAADLHVLIAILQRHEVYAAQGRGRRVTPIGPEVRVEIRLPDRQLVAGAIIVGAEAGQPQLPRNGLHGSIGRELRPNDRINAARQHVWRGFGWKLAAASRQHSYAAATVGAIAAGTVGDIAAATVADIDAATVDTVATVRRYCEI